MKEVKMIEKELHKTSFDNAVKYRKILTDEFNGQIQNEIPELKKGKGSYWTAPLNNYTYFYATFEFPKYIEMDNSFSIYTGASNSYVKPTVNMLVEKEKYVRFPYPIHHHLFEFNNVPWNKEHVGYLYWKLLMQRKKLHYYTDEQVEFVTDELFPFAIKQIARRYQKLYSQFENTNKSFPDRRIK